MDDWLLGSDRSIGKGDTAAKLNNPLIRGASDTPREESEHASIVKESESFQTSSSDSAHDYSRQ